MHYAIVTETYPPEINGVALTVQSLEAGLRALGRQVSLIRPRQARGEAAGSAQTLVAGIPLPGYATLRAGLPLAGQIDRGSRFPRGIATERNDNGRRCGWLTDLLAPLWRRRPTLRDGSALGKTRLDAPQLVCARLGGGVESGGDAADLLVESGLED